MVKSISPRLPVGSSVAIFCFPPESGTDFPGGSSFKNVYFPPSATVSRGVLVSTSSISPRNPVHRAMVGGLLFKHCLFPPGSREEKKIDRMLGNRQNLEES